MYSDDYQLFSVAKTNNKAESILTKEGSGTTLIFYKDVFQSIRWARGIVIRIYTSFLITL